MKKLILKLLELALLLTFCLLIWFVGDDIQIKHWIPLAKPESRLVSIAAIVLLWVLGSIFKYLISKRAEKKLATSFIEYSLKKVENNDAIALQAFKEKSELLIQDLESRQVVSGKKRIPLQKLPWFLVIGSPNSGKTSLLEESGLDFSFLSRLSQSRSGNEIFEIPWFAAEQAVFLEYTRFQPHAEWYEANNNEAWQLILKTLKHYKKWPAINGIIVAVDMVEFLADSEPERKKKMDSLRHYLKDVYELVKTPFPIYMVMTKCDQIAGFLEYFGRFSFEERGQILGFTLSEKLSDSKISEILDDKYEILIEQLNSKLSRLLEEEPESKIREQLCFFPKQIAMLKTSIVENIVSVLVPNKLYELIELRGIYFTSALPQNKVLCDPIRTYLDEKFGLEANLMRELLPTSSFFTRNLFKNIVIPEAWLLEQGKPAYKTRYWMYYLSFGISIGIMLLGSFSLTLGYFYNKAQADQAKEYLEVFQSNLLAKKKGLTLKEAIYHWDLLRNTWEIYSLNPHKWLLTYNIYQSPSIEMALKNKLQAHLNSEFLPDLLLRLETLLKNERISFDLKEELFKGYLALGFPDRTPKAWLTKAATYSWAQDATLTENEVISLKKNLDFMLINNFKPLFLNQELVLASRNYLFKTDLALRAYHTLNEHIQQQKHLNFDLLKEINNQEVFEDATPITISQYYTKNGLGTLYLPKVFSIVQALQADDAIIRSVLNEPLQKASTEEVVMAVNKLYVKDYLTCWKEAIAALTLKPMPSFEDLTAKFVILSGSNSPVGHFLRIFCENMEAILPLDKPSLMESPLAAFYLFSKSEHGDKNINKDRLFKSLDSMGKYLNTLNEQKDIHQASSKATQDTLNHQILTPINELMQQTKQFPEPLRAWIENLGISTWGILMENTNTYLNEKWQKEVLVPYQKLRGYFPFEPKGELSASLQSFEDFFAKEGIINNFIQAYLSPYLERSQDLWQWKSIYQHSLSTSSAIPQQLQQLSEISRQLYSSKDKGLDIRFTLTPFSLSPNIASVHLKIGADDIVYRHGPQSASKLSWQPAVQNERIVVNFRGFNGENITKSFDDQWSLLRLIDWGTLSRDETLDRYRVKLQVKDYQAEFLLKIEGEEAFEALLQGVELPDYF